MCEKNTSKQSKSDARAIENFSHENKKSKKSKKKGTAAKKQRKKDRIYQKKKSTRSRNRKCNASMHFPRGEIKS